MLENQRIICEMYRLRTKIRCSITNAIAFVTEHKTVVRVLKFVRGDSDIRVVVVKIVRVLKFVRMRITTYDTLTRVRNTGPGAEHLYNANT